MDKIILFLPSILAISIMAIVIRTIIKYHKIKNPDTCFVLMTKDYDIIAICKTETGLHKLAREANIRGYQWEEYDIVEDEDDE